MTMRERLVYVEKGLRGLAETVITIEHRVSALEAQIKRAEEWMIRHVEKHRKGGECDAV